LHLSRCETAPGRKFLCDASCAVRKHDDVNSCGTTKSNSKIGRGSKEIKPLSSWAYEQMSKKYQYEDRVENMHHKMFFVALRQMFRYFISLLQVD